MFRKNYFAFLLVAVLFLTGSVATFAQTSPVLGRVVVKKADGTTAPVADAVIDVYRIDIKAKFPQGKTNKKGEFSFAGFPMGGRFALAISAPNVAPQIFPGIKAGDEKITITVAEGDGRRFTEEEARQALTTAVATNNQPAQPTADQKKAEAEYQKKLVEYEAKKKNIENTSAVVNKALQEGDKEFKAKNYDAAIARFDEGINAEPDFAGSTPVLLNYKGAAFKERGFASFKGASAADAAMQKTTYESVKKDWNNALTAFNRGLEILKNAKETDPKLQKDYASYKLNILSNMMDTFRLLTSSRLDVTKSAEAKIAIDDYIATETDAVKKGNAQVVLGDILREGGDSENAITSYRKALEMSPDNPNALAGIGLSLFNSGVITDNKEQKQEGLNFMQRFIEVAPDNHSLKASVRDAVEYLKTQDKLAPQKTTKTTKKKT